MSLYLSHDPRSLNDLLTGLRGISESTRLRIVAILLHGELTVSELQAVLEQSQPRVSRHLRLLTEAGIVERHQEGSWVFYRLADNPLVDVIRRCIPRDDSQVQMDVSRLEDLHQANRERASAYFKRHAGEWDHMRSRSGVARAVERRLVEIASGRTFRQHVDLGTGTGRMVELFAPVTRSALGIDNSREMLAVARLNLADERFLHCQVRYGDIRHPELDSGFADLVTVHHVLHYLENPASVIGQASRLLEPGGMLLVVDFAPHRNERLRNESAHRRLGFHSSEIIGYMEEAGFTGNTVEFASDDSADGSSEPETVQIWRGERRNAVAADGPIH